MLLRPAHRLSLFGGLSGGRNVLSFGLLAPPEDVPPGGLPPAGGLGSAGGAAGGLGPDGGVGGSLVLTGGRGGGGGYSGGGIVGSFRSFHTRPAALVAL